MLYQTLVGAWPLGLAPDDEAGVRPSWTASPPGRRRRCARPSAAPNGRRRTRNTRPPAATSSPPSWRPTAPATCAPRSPPSPPASPPPAPSTACPRPCSAAPRRACPTCTRAPSSGISRLVDPDNRRPVDWAARRAALDAAAPAGSAAARIGSDGRVKQAVIAGALALRGRAPGAVRRGRLPAGQRRRPARAARPRLPPQPPWRGRADRLSPACRQRALKDSSLPLLPAAEWSGTDLLPAGFMEGTALAGGADRGGPARPWRPPARGQVLAAASGGLAGGGMSRIVVVSNRVPVPQGNAGQAGGLAVALHGLMQRRGGLWFGWSGAVTRNRGAAGLDPARRRRLRHHRPDRGEHRGYYTGYSNGVLWPMLHCRAGSDDLRPPATSRSIARSTGASPTTWCRCCGRTTASGCTTTT